MTRWTVFLQRLCVVAVLSLVGVACGSASDSATTITTTGSADSNAVADPSSVGTVEPSSTSQPISPSIPDSTTTTAKPAPTTTAQTLKTVAASIVSFGYNPNPITVNVGDTVRWTNTSAILHTATLSGGWDSGNLASGVSFSRVFDTPGVFNYFCTIHGAGVMSATVVVNP